MYQKRHLDIISKHKVLNADSSQPLKMTAFSRQVIYKTHKSDHIYEAKHQCMIKIMSKY